MAVIEAAEFAGTKTWAEGSAWVGGVVPTENDDVVFGEKSGTVEVAAEGKARSIKSTATYKGTLKVAAAITLKVGAATVNATNVIWEWLGGTFTAATTTANVTFGSSSATQVKIYANLSTFGAVKFTGKGSYLLEQKMSNANAGTVTIEECTFNSNGQECSWGFFNSSNALTRTINIENSIVKINATGTVWTMSTKTNLTFKPAGSTIELTDASVAAKSFVPGAEQKYNKLKFSGGASIPKFKLGTSCTINILEFTEGQKATLEVTANVKLTVEKIIAHGASGKLITMESATAGTAFEFTATAGTTFAGMDWCSFKDCHANATSTWYAGANSTNVSGNENLKFESFKHPHTFEVTQAQSTSRKTEPARNLTVAQAQAVARTTATARALAITQAQSMARVTTPARTFTATQGQTTSRTLADQRTLLITQLQSVQHAQPLTRTLSVAQPQVIARAVSMSRTLALAQAASVSRTTGVGRTLSTAQGQATSLDAHISLPPQVLTVEQPQSVTVGESLARTFTLTVAQATTLALARAIARTFTVSQAATPTLARSPARTLTAAQGQTVTRTAARSTTLTVSQSQAAQIARQVARLLTAAASQTTTLTGSIVQSLLPPADMVAGVDQPRDESSASAGPTMVSGVETSESKASVIG